MAARVLCPNCDALTEVEATSCVRCGAEYSEPEIKYRRHMIDVKRRHGLQKPTSIIEAPEVHEQVKEDASLARNVGRAVGSVAGAIAPPVQGPPVSDGKPAVNPILIWWIGLTVGISFVALMAYSERNKNASDGEQFVVFASNMIGWGLIVGLILLIFNSLRKK